MNEKILIVDDDLDTLRLIALMLQRQGYQTITTDNGPEALTLSVSERPDLILLDVMMAGMDGYEVTRQLRANPITSNLPIIMFTAKAQVNDKVMGFEVGVDDYLTKPTQPRELFAHVKAVLARGRQAEARPASPLPASERGYIIGVMAVKGGMGISTLALNLAVSLRLRTLKNVIVAELRPGQGSMALDLGYLSPEGMNRLLARPLSQIGLQEIEAELLTHKNDVRMLFSSYNPADARLMADTDHFDTIIRHLAFLAHYIVLDLGPAINPIADVALNSCDELIIALEPTPHTITRTHALVEELAVRGFGEARVNTVLYTRQRSDMQFSLAQVHKEYQHPIAIVFTPAPELMYQASRSNLPLVVQHPDNLTSQQFMKLADSIIRRVPSKE